MKSLSKIDRMNRLFCITGLLVFFVQSSFAQQFISKAAVEYEVKTNIKKTMGNSSWDELLKDAMPQFKTGYYLYTFADNKSVYKFDHWEPNNKMPDFMKRSDEDNVWYFDFDKGMSTIQKNIDGTNFNMQDSITRINWKITNESREIAGFNCRKAVGKLFDSVYVFAFYTDEITIPGGPCILHGLPGLIMGLTIPRMYMSFIATKVMVNNVAVADIKPVAAKKYYTTKMLKGIIDERTKEWLNSDDPDSKNWISQLIWNVLL
jgi:GLPGLI family protein